MSITYCRVCVCSLRYPACNSHAPYCHLWLVRLFYNFLHYLMNGTILKKGLFILQRVLWFSLQILSETFLILRRIEQATIKNVYWSSCEVSDILVKFERNLNLLDRFSKCTQISNFVLISSFQLALLQSVTFISRLMHSVLQNADVKIYVI
jgi:hypothetical protein